jgi:hemerythrin-like domain-containing protein
MATPLEVLLEDHRNTSRLLDALERQIGIFAEAGTPDYDVIVGVAEYFLDYPDLCHHPKENVIAARLLAAHPVGAAAIANLAGEHTVAHERARRFRRTVRALLADSDIAREVVVDAARRFIAFERRHMQMEEETFFPIAERLLSPADWRAIEAELCEMTDPVFGAQVAQSFRTVSVRLLAWETEDLSAIASGDQP